MLPDNINMSVKPLYDEQELLLQISEGNEQAFNILFNRHWDKLFNYLFRVVKSREAAEELCIDIFTKLWIGKDLIRDIKNMDGFLYTVAHNKAMDFKDFLPKANCANSHNLYYGRNGEYFCRCQGSGR